MKLASKMMEVMDQNLGLPKGYIKKALNEGMEDGEETTFFGKVKCDNTLTMEGISSGVFGCPFVPHTTSGFRF